MYKLNNKWNEINNLGPLEYYLYNGENYEGGILKNAKIIPPFSNDKILDIVKNDWLHLTDHEKKIYVYNKDYSVSDKFDGERTLSIYNPLICFFNYYVYAKDFEDIEDFEVETHELVLFIKKLSWKETGSEGCGWINYEDEYEIYLARKLDDIVNYAILPQEKFMFE